MSTIATLVVMWTLGWLAVAKVTIRRLLLGPTLASWTWRTEWAVAFAREVISVAAQKRDDKRLFQWGLRASMPVPLDLLRRVDVRRVKVGTIVADRYLPTDVFVARTTILYFHGGGYAFGNPGTHRQFIARLVHAIQTGAIAPRYRLAPLHRFPAAVDDAIESYEALIAAGIDPASIVVAGDSAGGGLAVAMLHRIRATGQPMPAGAMLFSPYLDLEHGDYTIAINAKTDYLPLAELSTPNHWYAAADELRSPEVSPIHADLTGFPPMLLFAGGAEMLLGDSLRFAENAGRDGVELSLVVEPEMMHVWPAFVEWEPASRRCLDTSRSWFHDLLGDRR